MFICLDGAAPAVAKERHDHNLKTTLKELSGTAVDCVFPPTTHVECVLHGIRTGCLSHPLPRGLALFTVYSIFLQGLLLSLDIGMITFAIL